MKVSSSIGFVVALAMLIGAPAAASGNEFGAIAFSQSTGAHGYSHNYPSRRGAEDRAMAECRAHGGGCRIAVWFANACGALAVGRGNGFGFSWASNRRDAENRAMRECSSRTSRCRTVRVVCSR